MPFNKFDIGVRFPLKQIGRSLWLQQKAIEGYKTKSTKFFNEQKNIKKPETMHWQHRYLQKMKGSVLHRKIWEAQIRGYDQKRVSFYVQNVLSQKKISIPLR